MMLSLLIVMMVSHHSYVACSTNCAPTGVPDDSLCIYPNSTCKEIFGRSGASIGAECACIDTSHCYSYDDLLGCTSDFRLGHWCYNSWSCRNCTDNSGCTSIGGSGGECVCLAGYTEQNGLCVSEFEMVFRATPESGNVYDSWVNSGTLGDDSMKTIASSPLGTYRNSVIDIWGNAKIEKVKFAMYNTVFGDMYVERFNIVFNGTGTDKTNWFASNKILSTTFTDLAGESFNQFSIFGLRDVPNAQRVFYINKSWSGCGGDIGWTSITDSQKSPGACPRDRTPAFRYCPGSTQCNMATETATADVVAVFVKRVPECPANYVELGSKCYRFVPDAGLKWIESLTACQDGDLLSVENEAELTLIRDHIQADPALYKKNIGRLVLKHPMAAGIGIGWILV